jgi:sugar lactone lactonase YvrE
MKHLFSLGTSSLSILAVACVQPTEPTEPAAAIGGESQIERACDATAIELPGDDFYPEGVAADGAGALYVGSVATGAIVRAEPCGEVTSFVPRRSGRGTFGLFVDTDASMLWACDIDPAFASPAALIGYDLATGAEAARHPFPADAVVCNDIAQGADGSLYLTDSFGARILRVPGATRSDGRPAEVWLTHPSFAAAPGAFGLNGITVVDERLFTASFANGSLHRVGIGADGAPIGPVEVALDRPLTGLDGLKAKGARTLFAVENRLFSEVEQSDLIRIDLAGDRGAVQVIVRDLDAPTTFAATGRNAWIAEGQLDHLLGIDPTPPTLPFRVVRAPLW